MKTIAFIILVLSSFHVSANKFWAEVFDSFNAAETKEAALSKTTEQYRSLFGKRGFKLSNIVDYEYRRFSVGDKFGLLLLENIQTNNPTINEVYKKLNYTQGVLLRNEGRWLVERIFEPKSAALTILIDTPDWFLSNKGSDFTVDTKTYHLESAVAFQNPDGSVWINFFPFKLDSDDLDALVWGENNVIPANENKASTIASTAIYHKFFMHIPDVDNLMHDVKVGFFNLDKEGYNETLMGRGKDFIEWAEIRDGFLVLKAAGFLPAMTPVVSIDIKFKIPLWHRGIINDHINTDSE